MAWEEDKKVYIHKLEAILNGIEELEKLKNSRVITAAMHEILNELRERSNVLLPKLKRDEFEIAVVGLEKSGKSSFTNALIGRMALPTDDQRCTYTSTCIRPGEHNSADVFFYTAEEFDTDFREKLSELGISNASSYSMRNLSLDEYKRLYGNCDEKVKKLYEDSLNQDIIDILENKNTLQRYIGSASRHFDSKQIDSKEFKEFITSPGKAVAVKNIVIYSSELREMPNAVIYDVPGFNSPTAMHLEQTLEKMRNADAIVMVAKANEPSITGDVLKIFKNSDVDGELLSSKLFVFSNKADLATDLEENKAITFNEWLKKRKILPDTSDSEKRFVFGSANAHLGIGNSKDALKRNGFDDGIDLLRSKLEEYYRTDRFTVLKKRIDKILFDIEELFKELKNDTSVPQYSNADLNMIVLGLLNKLQKNVSKNLESLKKRINDEAKTNPLSSNITDCIDQTVTLDRYEVTSEEIDSIHNSIAGIGDAPQPQSLDSELRKTRFWRMYDDFEKAALICTSSHHKKVCSDILDVFRNCMDLAPNDNNWIKIEKQLIELFLLETDKANPTIGDNIYYQSLIERFARDVFEILIKTSKGPDRLEKFRQAAVNYFSLGVFYNAGTASEKNDNLSYIEAAPKDSMLWRILLYPELASANIEKAKMIEKLRELTGLNKIGSQTEELLGQLIITAGTDAAEKLEAMFADVDKSSPQPTISSLVKEKLTNAVNASDMISPNFLDQVLNHDRYLEDSASRLLSYKMVAEEFSRDVVALHLILKKAVVPAANLDTAFSAREIKLIEDIIKTLYEEPFMRFVSENAELIESAKIERIKDADEQRKLDAAVINEVKKILKAITKSS